MTGSQPDLVDDFPAELTARLDRLAGTETAGSLPWPRVDRAINRSRRRRTAGAATLATAGLLTVGALFGGLFTASTDSSEPAPPAGTSAPAVVEPTPTTAEQAGLTGEVGGSAADDGDWLDGLRDQVITLTTREGSSAATSRKKILILWAGDLNGSRYAVVCYQGHAPGRPAASGWGTLVLQGPAGAEPTDMTQADSTSWDQQVPNAALTMVLKADQPNARSAGVILVVAAKATAVEVSTARRFAPNGQATTDRRPLTKQGGAVWVGELTEAELFLSQTRITGMSEGGGSAPVPDYASAAEAIAAAGTDVPTLGTASRAAYELGASLQETVVLAAGRSLGKQGTMAATVLKSPTGGYLFGFGERRRAGSDEFALSAAAISAETFASPESFMAAVAVENADTAPQYSGPHYLVIAPAGAEQVSFRGTTVPVTNRIAVIGTVARPAPDDDSSTAVPAELNQVTALDAAGKPIGTTTVLTEDLDGSGDEIVPGRLTVTAQDLSLAD